MRFFPGPQGPGFAKSAFGAVPLLRLSFFSQRSRSSFRRRGGPMWPPADRSGISCEGNRTALYPRRGEAEGESAEGRERPPWGVPFPAPL